jgi:hypothetical protein
MGDETLDEVLQFLFGPLHTVRQPLLAESTEEAFEQFRGGVAAIRATAPGLASCGLAALAGQIRSW